MIRNKILIFLTIISLTLPNFAFLRTQGISQPENLEETETLGAKILKSLPRALKEPWQEALRVWGRMWNWLKEIWNSYIFPWLKSLWQKIKAPFIKEIERRKPIIEKEFEKEKIEMKEEIKTELPKTTKSLWQRFRDIIK